MSEIMMTFVYCGCTIKMLMLFSLTVEEAAGGLDGVLLTLLDKTLSLHSLVGGDTQALLIKTRRLVWS